MNKPDPSAELKPCPFCGCEIILIGEPYAQAAEAYCDGCGAIHDLKMWNTRALDAAQPAGEAVAEGWRCEQCGDMADAMSPAWRWAGDRWQHHHAQVGHVDARNFASQPVAGPPPADEVARDAHVVAAEFRGGPWIPARERLPDDGQSVAFVVKASDRLAYLDGTVLGGTYRASKYSPGFGVPGLGVDAWFWMPLPPPPTDAAMRGGEASNG